MRAVLTFHSIDNSGSVVSYPVELFDRLLKSLRRQDIPVLSLDQLLSSPDRAGVVLTFDDGMRSVYQNALPIMRYYDVPAHLFLTTSVVDSNEPWPRQPCAIPSFDMLSWGEIEQLHDGGVFIDAHTSSHPDIRSLGLEQIQEECDRVDQALENRLGRRPEYFAYPFGYHNATSREYIRNHYRAAVTTELRYLSAQEDLAALPRLDSYYLQQTLAQDHLNSVPLKGYLWLRWLLRSWRGSHCVASC